MDGCLILEVLKVEVEVDGKSHLYMTLKSIICDVLDQDKSFPAKCDSEFHVLKF